MMKDGVTPNKANYNQIINYFAQIGDVQRAQIWLQEMVSNGHHVDDFTMVSLSKAHMRISGSVDTVKAARLAYEVIVSAYSHIGDHAKAEHWSGQKANADLKFRNIASRSPQQVSVQDTNTTPARNQLTLDRITEALDSVTLRVSHMSV